MKKIVLLTGFSFGASLKLKACDSAAINYGHAQDKVILALVKRAGVLEARLSLVDAYVTVMKYCKDYYEYTKIIIPTHKKFIEVIDRSKSF